MTRTAQPRSRFWGRLLYRYVREARHARRLLRAGGTHARPVRELKGYRTSDTLFILGSGGSICELSDTFWAAIARHDSLGFNYWPIHDFVPTLYAIEEPRDPERAATFLEILRRREVAYRTVPVLVKQVRSFDASILPDGFRHLLHVGAALMLPAENVDELRRGLRQLRRTALLRLGFLASVVPFARSSVDYLVMSAYLLGYRRIVLCGVDLSDTRYFYEVDAERYEVQGLPVPETGQSGAVHKTIDPAHGSLTVDRVLMVMRDELLAPAGVELLVAHDRSALYPALPLYRP